MTLVPPSSIKQAIEQTVQQVSMQTIKQTIKQTSSNAMMTHGMVAIVDDDPHISRALGMWLELHGLRAAHHISAESLLQAIHLENGALALHIGVSNPLVFPLVGAVIDLNLPGITGFALADRLRKMAPGLPLAIMTALRDDERVCYGHPPAGVQCVKKPFDLALLEDALFPLIN
jgi:DNA-binding response OmpR family regulator